MLGPIEASGTWAKRGHIQSKDMCGPMMEFEVGVGEIGVFAHW